MFDDEEVQSRPEEFIGQNLESWSVKDLEDLIMRLQTEIKRVEGERVRKSGGLSVAESLFKS